MKILRVKDTFVTLWDLRDWLSKREVFNGERFGISWKQGKRRKLRAYRLVDHEHGYCDQCCNNWDSVILSRGGKTIYVDNHLGLSHLSM